MPYSEGDRLSSEALRQSLDGIFNFDVSSGRSYEELIEALASLSRGEQDFSLHWAMVAVQTHLEIAYLVVLLMPEALRRLGAKPAEAWVVAALDGFDRIGLRNAVIRLRDIEGFARGALGHVIALESLEGRLARFLRGLSGRSLQVGGSRDGMDRYRNGLSAADDRHRQPRRRHLVLPGHGHAALGAGALRYVQCRSRGGAVTLP